MSPSPMVIAFGFVLLAALLDVAANGFVSRSNGFKELRFAIPAILLVWSAFTCLSFAVKEIELAVAYATWGAIGILGTALLGWLINDDRLGAKGWAGITTMIVAVIVMKLG